MNKALECALSLTEEFHKAQYLDDVDPKTVKALAAMMLYALDLDECDQVLKKLAKIDPEADIGELTEEYIHDHPKLTKEERVRLMFWSLAMAVTLFEMEDVNMNLGPADKAEARLKAKEWGEEVRRELEEYDPDFARYVFGPAP